jgi:hypothetical protein
MATWAIILGGFSAAMKSFAASGRCLLSRAFRRYFTPPTWFCADQPAYQQLIGHRDVIGLIVREAFPELKVRIFLSS